MLNDSLTLHIPDHTDTAEWAIAQDEKQIDRPAVRSLVHAYPYNGAYLNAGDMLAELLIAGCGHKEAVARMAQMRDNDEVVTFSVERWQEAVRHISDLNGEVK